MRTTPWFLAAVLGGASSLIGCLGVISDAPARPDDCDPTDEACVPVDPEDLVPPPPGVVAPAPQSRAPRLTHAEWERTVADLLYLDRSTVAELTGGLRVDSLPGEAVFQNPGGALAVDEVLWGGYQRAAVELAARVTGDQAALERLIGSGVTRDEAGATEVIRALGLRAHRRPLEEVEVDEYLTLYRRAAGLFGTLDAFRSGLRLVLEAMLQSPHFLYRIELANVPQDGVIPLGDYEVASRLSYALWGSMPDEELFAAAAARMLTDATNVEEQARRMLDDPRAEGMVVDFHRQLFDVDKYDGISPSPDLYPDAPRDLAALARAEHDRFVSEIVLSQDGGYRDLLTSTTTFANDALARIYGLSGSFGSELAPVSLDPSQRRGIFTQVGFLAANATRADPDPIHRGVFLAERIACIHINAPPANTPPVTAVPGRTNRQMIEDHTQQPGSVCAGCHAQVINPFGFPFEHYDAIGAFRTEDRGFPIDSTASPPIDDTPTPVADATELAEALADSQAAHECYAQHWIEYALGRAGAEEDAALVAQLALPSRSGALPVRDLIVGIVTSQAFLARSVREVSE